MYIFELPERNNRQRLVKALLITVIVVCIATVLAFLPIKLESPKLINQEAGSFDIYDLHYLSSDKGRSSRDENVILIEIGNNRREIAEQILALQQLSPAVIGLDVMFERPKDSVNDTFLTEVLGNCSTCVTASRFIENEKGELEKQYSFFKDAIPGMAEGYINFYPSDTEDWPVVRTFLPFIDSNYSFTSRIVKKYNPEKFTGFRNRNNKTETIYYSGTLEHYYRFTAKEITDPDTSGILAEKISGKIALLGFFQNTSIPEVLEDIHFTPLNDKPTGKSPPDMYGINIHANILSMILENRYITAASVLFSYASGALMIFLYLFLEMFFDSRNIRVPGLIKTLLNISIVVIITWLCLLLFSHFRIKIPLFPIVLLFIVKEIHESLIKGSMEMISWVRHLNKKKNQQMKALLLLTILAAPHICLAQTRELYTDIVKGEAYITRPGKAAQPLKAKTFLTAKDILTLKDKAEVTLVSSANRYLELKEKGTYTIEQLRQRVLKKGSTVTEKYFSMIWNEVKNPETNASVNVENVAKSFGGVSRAGCEMNMYPAGGSVTNKNAIQFAWNKQDTAGQYTFTLMKNDRTVLIQTNLSDTQYVAHIQSYTDAGNQIFFWNVKKTDHPCGSETIHKLIWLPQEKYTQVVEKVANSVSNDGTHRYYLDVSQKLLDHGLYLSAAEYLLKAFP